jgi:hypothetical protein
MEERKQTASNLELTIRRKGWPDGQQLQQR